jgi:hypothetical protein
MQSKPVKAASSTSQGKMAPAKPAVRPATDGKVALGFLDLLRIALSGCAV